MWGVYWRKNRCRSIQPLLSAARRIFSYSLAKMGELAAAMQVLHAHQDVPVTILGNGSNVLVLDRGIRGAVIKLGDFLSSLRREDNRIFAGAGSL